MRFQCVCEPEYTSSAHVPYCPICLSAWYDLMGTWRRTAARLKAEAELLAEGRRYRHQAVLLPWASEEQLISFQRRATLHLRAQRKVPCTSVVRSAGTSGRS